MSSYEWVLENGKRMKGRADWLKLVGENKGGLRNAINAMCYECNGYGVDGRPECESPCCPLNKFTPYPCDK